MSQATPVVDESMNHGADFPPWLHRDNLSHTALKNEEENHHIKLELDI